MELTERQKRIEKLQSQRDAVCRDAINRALLVIDSPDEGASLRNIILTAHKNLDRIDNKILKEFEG